VALFDRLIRRGEDSRLRKGARNGGNETVSSLVRNVSEDKAKYPEDTDTIEAFSKFLQSELENWSTAEPEETPSDDASQEGASAGRAPRDEEVRFYLAQDRMKAFACLLPPQSGGKELDIDNFKTQAHYEGITSGILMEEMWSRLRAKDYLHIFPMAEGKAPKEGVDGTINELFQCQESTTLEVPGDSVIDFASMGPVQAVKKGDVLCRITPPVPGEDGMDVTGRVLPCRETVNAKILVGQNTSISSDGLTLLAAKDGLLYKEDGKICIAPQTIIEGDLSSYKGVLHAGNSLYITGNVLGGVAVEAEGDILIGGQVLDAKLTSVKGCIRVQKGVNGSSGGSVVLKAGQQVQAPFIEDANIEAGSDIITERLVNCHIRCGGLVNVLGGRGMLVGGDVQAAGKVVCRRIGNVSGQATRLIVGCSPGVVSEWEAKKQELAMVQETLDKLWSHIGKLRNGKIRSSEEEKSVLNQLVEQRELYDQKRTSVKEELRELEQELKNATKGCVICEEIFPPTEIQIGRYKKEFTTAESNCSIQVVSGDIVCLPHNAM